MVSTLLKSEINYPVSNDFQIYSRLSSLLPIVIFITDCHFYYRLSIIFPFFKFISTDTFILDYQANLSMLYSDAITFNLFCKTDKQTNKQTIAHIIT